MVLISYRDSSVGIINTNHQIGKFVAGLVERGSRKYNMKKKENDDNNNNNNNNNNNT